MSNEIKHGTSKEVWNEARKKKNRRFGWAVTLGFNRIVHLINILLFDNLNVYRTGKKFGQAQCVTITQVPLIGVKNFTMIRGFTVFDNLNCFNCLLFLVFDCSELEIFSEETEESTVDFRLKVVVSLDWILWISFYQQKSYVLEAQLYRCSNINLAIPLVVASNLKKHRRLKFAFLSFSSD